MLRRRLRAGGLGSEWSRIGSYSTAISVTTVKLGYIGQLYIGNLDLSD